MKQHNSDSEYSPSETARRRDEIVRRMIATPPTPHAPLKAKKKPSRPAQPKKKTAKTV